MSLLALAAAAVSLDPELLSVRCASTDQTFQKEQLALASNQAGEVSFAELDGRWAKSIRQGQVKKKGASSITFRLSDGAADYIADIEKSDEEKSLYSVEISRVVAGNPPSVVFAAGVCEDDPLANKDVAILKPLQRDLPATTFPLPGGPLMFDADWAMKCALMDQNGKRQDLAAILSFSREGTSTVQFFDAAWMGIKLGPQKVIYYLGTNKVSAAGEAKRPRGFAMMIVDRLKMDWKFDYFDEGHAEPEMHMTLAFKRGASSLLLAGMCNWKGVDEVSSGVPQ